MKHVNLGTGALGVLAAGLMMAFSGTPLQAQQQPAQPAPADVQELEEETIETFAMAYLEISDLRMQMQSQLQNVQDEDRANQIQQEANNQMQSILEDHDLNVQEYQEITQVLNADPEQRQQFEETVEEIREEEGAPGQPG